LDVCVGGVEASEVQGVFALRVCLGEVYLVDL